MELYATGFNALNQLAFEASQKQDEPDDVYAFTKVLQGTRIDRPLARLASTCGAFDLGWPHAAAFC